MIYLDNSATARPSEKAISAMLPFWTTHWGSPTAPHQKGQELYPHITSFYQTLYSFIGAKEEDSVILTSCGAEGINHLISSVYRGVTLSNGKNHFLTSQTDEASSIMSISHLEPFGCVGKMVEVNSQGVTTKEAVAQALSPRTALVSLSWANGLTGTIHPVAEIAALCKERGVLFHLDATHVLGKLFYELEEIGPDYLTCNGDQLHAPRGTGLLYIKKGAPAAPFIFGSADQGGMRAGGLNIAALAGLATAAKEVIDARDLLSTETARLKVKLEQGIQKGFPQAILCYQNQERLPHCTTILFPGIANEALLFGLNRRNLCASIGGGNFQQLSNLIASSGIEAALAQTALSFSLSRTTTEEEIDRAITIILETLHHLNRIRIHES